MLYSSDPSDLLELYFTSFELESGNPCTDMDYVQIRDGKIHIMPVMSYCLVADLFLTPTSKNKFNNITLFIESSIISVINVPLQCSFIFVQFSMFKMYYLNVQQ